MSARTRRSTAVAVIVAVTAGTALLLTGCEPSDPSQPATGTPTGTTPSKATTAKPSPGGGGSTAPALNGTAHNGLTISNGTRNVVMNGTVVDFGTTVRDLTWSRDGRKAAFIDGDGNLVVSNPDGGGKTVVAKNPGGQTWSHPAWQVTPDNDANHVPVKNFLFFAASQGGTTKLERVSATAVNGTPEELELNSYFDENAPVLPKTGNVWPNTGGNHGGAVYANSDNGQVYIRDDYLRQQGRVLTKGSEPAYSPDEQHYAFVRSVDGHDHLFVNDFGTGAPKDLTPHATTDYTEPAFSPDGKTIAVRTPDGIDTVPADGSAAPARISGYTGLPAYRG